MIDVIKYTSKYKKILFDFMDQLQDYLVSVDSFKTLSRPEGYGKKYVDSLLKIIKDSRGVILLAEDNGEIVGCAAGIIDKLPLCETLGHKKKYKSARVLELYVNQEFRGKKVGALLIKKIEEYFLAKKCDQIRIEVYAPNKNAHQFYQKQGYQDESIDLVKNL